MLDPCAEAAAAVVESRRLIAEGRETLAYMHRVWCEMQAAAIESGRIVEDAKRVGAAMACAVPPDP